MDVLELVKNRRKVKLYYWGDGMNIFFLEYKDKNFFCCLQTFFITGVTFSDRPVIIIKTLLGCFPVESSTGCREKHSWGNNPVTNS